MPSHCVATVVEEQLAKNRAGDQHMIAGLQETGNGPVSTVSRCLCVLRKELECARFYNDHTCDDQLIKTHPQIVHE